MASDDKTGNIAYSGAEIKAARQRARLSQAALGARVGVDGRRVRSWETQGITYGAHTLAAVEDVLGLGGRPRRGAFDDKTSLELIAQMHAIAAELAARELRDGHQHGPPIRLPETDLHIPRVVDLPADAEDEDEHTDDGSNR